MAIAIDEESHAEIKRQLAQCELDGERMSAENAWLRAALDEIAGIAEGSGTLNSLPHIAKIARAAYQQKPDAL